MEGQGLNSVELYPILKRLVQTSLRVFMDDTVRFGNAATYFSVNLILPKNIIHFVCLRLISFGSSYFEKGFELQECSSNTPSKSPRRQMVECRGGRQNNK